MTEKEQALTTESILSIAVSCLNSEAHYYVTHTEQAYSVSLSRRPRSRTFACSHIQP